METQTNSRPATAQGIKTNPQSQPAPSPAVKPAATPATPQPAAANGAPAPNLQNPSQPQPVPPDPQAAILAELRALRSSIDTGFRDLLEGLDEKESSEPTLATPASASKSTKTASNTVQNGTAIAGSNTANTMNAPKSVTESVRVDTSRNEAAPLDKSDHQRRSGERRSDWLDRLRTLGPIGTDRRHRFEKRDVYEARRFDGSKSDD